MPRRTEGMGICPITEATEARFTEKKSNPVRRPLWDQWELQQAFKSCLYLYGEGSLELKPST